MDKDKKIATRTSFGEALKEIGDENKNVVVLDADLSGATKTNTFAKAHPDRFFDMGIAESNMIAVASRDGYMWKNTICCFFCSVFCWKRI